MTDGATPGWGDPHPVRSCASTRPSLPRRESAASSPILGILALETRFPRIPGDVGNPDTWPFPVAIRTVRTASPGRVVRGRAEGLIDAFVGVGEELVAEGAAGIVTTCGFLVLAQSELQARLPVPVATSSLLQVPLVARLLPEGRRSGIVTADPASLSRDHLSAAGIDPSMAIAGPPPDSHFAEVFLGDAAKLDAARAERDVVDAALGLVRRDPQIGAVVLECANMAPYSAAVHRATGLQVYDAVGFATWFRSGLAPRVFARPAA